MWWHLTLNGKITAVYYWFRKLVIKPAPDGERCFMGGTVHPMVACPRYALDDELWCRQHAKTASPALPLNPKREDAT